MKRAFQNSIMITYFVFYYYYRLVIITLFSTLYIHIDIKSKSSLKISKLREPQTAIMIWYIIFLTEMRLIINNG